MRATQEGAMQDECEILEYSSVSDGYGNPRPRYTAIATLSCGFQHVRPREVLDTGELAMIDATLRLPIDTVIGTHDRVRVTKRYREALATAEVYEIVGPKQRGPSGLVLSLRMATSGDTT
ncbi:MAG TPA: hypothetical protein VM537_16240 [Anaerolineae bacterium]|nr:hypothetical protein [Anaerolineae bacterium]